MDPDPDILTSLSSSDELLSVLQISALPEQLCDFEYPYDADFFKEFLSGIQSKLLRAIFLLESIENIQDNLRKEIVVHTVLLCGEHSENSNWTSTESLRLSNVLLQKLLNKFNSPAVPDLLLQFGYKTFFSKLRVKLDKTHWKKFPAAVLCLKWILNNTKCPYLGDHLNAVLPTCLILVDDHECSNKVTGLHCLQKVAENVSRTELTQYGRGDVVYKALEHMIYLREPEIVRALGSCLVAVLSSIEHQPNTATLSWSHFDDVMNIWLPSMEMEQKLALREAYIDSLCLLVSVMGLAAVRWSRKLLAVLSEYSEHENTRDKALQCLQTLIQTAWPRISCNFESVVLILLKVVLRITSEPESKSFHSLNLVKECFHSLENLCEPQYTKLVSEIREENKLNCLYSVLSIEK